MLSPRLQDVLLEQADAAAISEGEEVTLMDWGNAIIKVNVRSLCAHESRMLCQASNQLLRL